MDVEEMNPADPSLMYQRESEDAPGTHVLIVGLGHYPRMAGDAGILHSPPRSARAMADWFLDHFDNPDAPLASVGLVISEVEPNDYHHPKMVAPLRPPGGTTQDIFASVRAWLERAERDALSQAIFFFCGHGLQGVDNLLLTRDFGTNGGNPFDDALDFGAFCRAMATRMPGRQLFLIDACRRPRPDLDIAAMHGNRVGRCPILPSDPPALGRLALQSAHHATSGLGASHGLPNGLSFFTLALLAALNGGGAQPNFGYQWVGTSGLDMALSAYVARLADENDTCQVPDRIRGNSFKVHRPGAISVPVYVTFEPARHAEDSGVFHAEAQGTVRNTHDWRVDKAQIDEWKFVTEHCEHQISAEFRKPARYADGRWLLHVAPPETEFELPLEDLPS